MTVAIRPLQVLDLFPKTVATYEVGPAAYAELVAEATAAEYRATAYAPGGLNDISTGRRVLDRMPLMRAELIETLRATAEGVFMQPGRGLNITTSWFTRTRTGGGCQRHLHSNSVLSGVVFASGGELGGHLQFHRPESSGDGLSLGVPSEYTIRNSELYSIVPAPGLVVIFPSFLRHSVTEYRGEAPRYSLAFNSFPTRFGSGDSELEAYVNPPE
jgi:hypothetical protein